MKTIQLFAFAVCCILVGCGDPADGIVDNTEEQGVLFLEPVGEPASATTCLNPPGGAYVLVFDARAVGGSVQMDRLLVEATGHGSADAIVAGEIWTPDDPSWTAELAVKVNGNVTRTFLYNDTVGRTIADGEILRVAVRVELDAQKNSEVKFTLRGVMYNGLIAQGLPILGSRVTLSADQPCP